MMLTTADCVKRFRFQPDGSGREAAIFARRGVGDVDRDQADELIGGYGPPADASQAQVPFALDWDDAGALPDGAARPRAAGYPQGDLDPGLEPLLAAYSQPITLHATSTRSAPSGYRAQDFAGVDPEPSFRLLAGYL